MACDEHTLNPFRKGFWLTKRMSNLEYVIVVSIAFTVHYWLAH